MRQVFCLLLTMTAPAVLGAQEPRTSFDGPALGLDFPGLHIGVAEYDEGPTGATVFYFPDGAKAAVDVRGGAPGTIGTDFLRLSYDTPFVDAISFAGGSSYGLAAATGAAAEILSMREGDGSWGNIATVPGAIIFDLGPRRFNAVVPDEALGRAALRAARPGRFPLGARGAGRFATHGGYFDTPGAGIDRRQHSGQGGAFRQVGDVRVAVFTVVNSLGVVVDREGQVVRCPNHPDGPDCGSAAELIAATLDERTEPEPNSEAGGPTENTTLTLVVTNQALDFWALQRLAVQVHTSMARAIQPFQTQRDGDVLFAVSTGEVEDTDMNPETLGVLASEVAWDAVLASVPELPPVDTTVAEVDAAVLDAHTGRYIFGPEAELTITRNGDRLFAEATGGRPIYGFQTGERVEIFPSSETDFFSHNIRGDHLRFPRNENDRGAGLVLNPGPWELTARRER